MTLACFRRPIAAVAFAALAANCTRYVAALYRVDGGAGQDGRAGDGGAPTVDGARANPGGMGAGGGAPRGDAGTGGTGLPPGTGGTGGVGGALACQPACPVSPSACARDQILSCAVGGDGCAVTSSTACAAGLFCQRRDGPLCVDPQWAAWPVPNGPGDVGTGAPNPATLVNNGDDTVSDTVTGLMWQRTVAITTYAPTAAVGYCQRLRAGGHDDWRVPAAIELASIVDHGRFEPSIDTVIFPDTPAASFLTTTTGGRPTTVWLVDFTTGTINVDPNFATGPRNVRCVR